MFSTEKLIFEVQNYPCLWDMSCKNYNDKNLKDMCWLKVAESLFSFEWDTFGTEEKDEKVKEIKTKKWRHIRDAYMKYLTEEKNIRSGSEALKRKPYAYAEMLSFLNTTVKKRKTTGNFDNVDDDIVVDSIVENVYNDVSEEPHNISTSTQQPKSLRQGKQNTTISHFQTSLLQHLHQREERESDPDRNLVMSFLPYLKKLNTVQKLDFQINGLQYLKNAMNQPNLHTQSYQPNIFYQPGPQYPLPNSSFPNVYNYYMYPHHYPPHLYSLESFSSPTEIQQYSNSKDSESSNTQSPT